MNTNRLNRPLAGFALMVALTITLGACGEPTGADAGSQPEGSIATRILPPRTERITVPAGTLLVARFEERLSSHDSRVGQPFRASIEQDISIQGKLAIPAGARIRGEVTEAAAARKIGGRARLTLAFRTLELPSGKTVPISAVFADRGKSERAKDAAIIGGSTLGGAILGEAVDEGEGTVIGAVVGGLAGTAAALKTRGKPVTVEPGTLLTLALSEALTVEI